MKSVYRNLTLWLCAIAVAACSPVSKPTITPTEPSMELPIEVPPRSELRDSFAIYDFPNARSVSIAGVDNGNLFLVFGTDHSLYVSHSTDAGRTFAEPMLATASSHAHVLPVERPAIAVDSENRVGIAWLELPPDFEGAHVWYAVSEDAGQTFSSPVLAGSESSGEVTMVQAAIDARGNPYLAWLNGSELNFTRSFDGGATFTETVRIGSGSCECCQPQLIVDANNIYLAYRGLEDGGARGDIRDILLLRSNDGGESFAPITRVSDTHWYLPACPIAGPSMALHGGNLYVTFMDGRFEPVGTFGRGDAWFSVSNDSGESFSANVRINIDQDAHHTLPSIAVGPGSRIHVTWESFSQGDGTNNLYYTTSDDGGWTFALPRIFADNRDPSLGNPGKPVLFIDSTGNLALAWLDRSGAHVASWVDAR